MFHFKPSRNHNLGALLTGWRVSITVGIFILIVFIYLARMIHYQDKNNLENHLRLIMESRASDVENTLNSFEAMASRMAKRFNLYKNFTYNDWKAEARMHFENFPGIYAFVNLENSGRILWKYPENNIKDLEQLTSNSDKVQLKLKSLISGKDSIVIMFPDKTKPVILILAANREEKSVSGITGVLINVKETFAHYLPRGSSGLALYYKGLELYNRGIDISPGQEKWKRRIYFYNYGDKYLMEVWPGKQIMAMNNSSVSSLILVAGLILGILTTILMRILNRLHYSSNSLRQVNLLLAQENIAKEIINNDLRKLQRAAEQSPNAIIITDPDGIIEYVNPKISQITGYTASELIGKKTNIFKSGKTSKNEYIQLWETIRNGGQWFGEFYNRKKDGTCFWAGTSISGVYNNEGHIVNYISTQEDISKRKDNEKELREHAVALELAQNEKDQIILELNKTQAELEESSRTDYLTGLLNRRGMDLEIQNEMKRFTRSGKSFSFILSDIDHFKKINDKYGHDTGDFILSETSRLLKSIVRSQDIIARWGGEEFLIMLPETDLDGSTVLAENIRSTIESNRFIFRDTLITITMSFGISVMSEPGIYPENCLRIADQNLYRAKEEGRNRVIFNIPV